MIDVEPFCRKVTNLILPAVRASIAEALSDRYGYTQAEIAKRLGIAQVAVSKYINRRYSERVRMVKDYIQAKGLNSRIINRIISGESTSETERHIDLLCNNSYLVGFISRNVMGAGTAKR